jgi:hypothetical protein
MKIRKTAAVAAILAVAAGFGSSVSASAASAVPARVSPVLTLDEMNCISAISSHDPATVEAFCGK